MRVRFVGGPWHNRIHETSPGDLSPVWYVATLPDGHKPGIDDLHDGCWTREPYHLHRFRTSRGTRYVQYVHESLIANNGKPLPEVCKERFKPWSLVTK